jgi:hypothetical protein
VKSIDEASKKALYIELDFKKGQQQKGQEETNKNKGKKIATTTQRGKIPRSIANTVM